MSDPLLTFDQENLMGTPNAISLPESPGGLMPSNSPDGPMTDRYGLEVVHANLSHLQACRVGLATSATYGQVSSGSSHSVSLQSSLESRLRRNLDGAGFPGCVLTWKHWVMGSGLPICALRVSGHRTPDKGSTLWPTPSGTSNHGKNHVVGRLDEWGGSSNPFRGTNLARVRCVSFELWMMGFPTEWPQRMPRGTPSSRKLQPLS